MHDNAVQHDEPLSGAFSANRSCTDGVPTGMQIIGRTYSVADVFRAAMAYETAVGGWYAGRGARPEL